MILPWQPVASAAIAVFGPSIKAKSCNSPMAHFPIFAAALKVGKSAVLDTADMTVEGNRINLAAVGMAFPID